MHGLWSMNVHYLVVHKEQRVVVNAFSEIVNPTIKPLYRRRSCCSCELHVLSCVESSHFYVTTAIAIHMYLTILLLEAYNAHPLLCFVIYHLTLGLLQSSHTAVSAATFLSHGHSKLSKHVLSWAPAGGVVAMNNKCHIAASISVGLPENHQLVQVLCLRMISGECNTRWFVLLFRVWIVVIASAVVMSW